ncbi:MAG: LysR family transcriptional regulator [Nitrospinaceae bacterium]|jgi:LysR family transcriptional activator of nhaA|nr:MAG: LysR family transcriptional regulator [Nitrospinaceae bacterium]
MNLLNYQHLYYFRVVAQEGSVSQAAKKLRLGQPAISIQLRQLEAALGWDLFERRNRRLVLTEAGEVALKYADQIFQMGDELREVLKDQTFSRRPHLQLGVLDSIPKKFIQDAIEFVRESDDCLVTVLEGKGEFLFSELLSHRIDLVVSNYPPAINDRKPFYSRLLGTAPIAVFGTEKFSPLKKGFPGSLDGQPVILPTLHSRLRHDLEHYFRVKGIGIRLVVETQDTAVQKILGGAGEGLVPLPRFAGLEGVSQGEWIEIGKLVGVKEDFWLVSSPRQIENPLAARLMESFQLITQ